MKDIGSLIGHFAQPVLCFWAQLQCKALLRRLNEALLELRSLQALSQASFIHQGKRDELVEAFIEEDLELAQGILTRYVQDFTSWCQRASASNQAKLWLQFQRLGMESDLNVA